MIIVARSTTTERRSILTYRFESVRLYVVYSVSLTHALQRMTTHCTIARLVFVLVSNQPLSYYCTSDLHISYVSLPYSLNAIIKDSVPLQYTISLAACGMLNGTPATIDSCQLLPWHLLILVPSNRQSFCMPSSVCITTPTTTTAPLPSPRSNLRFAPYFLGCADTVEDILE